nr:UDP-N-acetylmuramate dehydrogenase [Desulfobacterales bacterium]
MAGGRRISERGIVIGPDERGWLIHRFENKVLFNEPMSRHTTFRIGGPADVLVYPSNIQGLMELVTWARMKQIPLIVIGAGSNLIVRDGGIRGIVVKLSHGFDAIHHENGPENSILLTAGAGTLLGRLNSYAIRNGISGLNFTIGIPGTVGGAVLMNAGAEKRSIGDVIESVNTITRDLRLESLCREKLHFSYRQLNLDRDTIILDACFRLFPGETEALRREAISLVKARQARQPLALPSAGSIFKNPASGEAAGFLIEKAGLKGTRSGDAEVSTKHANFIVNRGDARAADVLSLIRHVQKTVSKLYGIDLELEVKIVGQETRSEELLQE